MVDFSFQLYSARKFPPLDHVLSRLAQLGYAQVEGYGGIYEDPAALAASLRAHGLTMPTGHFGLDLLKDTDKAMKIAETLGVKMLFCPAVPQAERSQPEAGWKALAETLAGLNEVYTKAGFGFGWHNHAFEFKPTETGSLPMNLILDGAPGISWEVDVAWLVVGGQTLQPWLDKYGQRIVAIHVKDLAPQGENPQEDGQADVGHGTLDWQALYTSIKSGTRTRYYVMEHDNPSDFERFASRSIASCKAWK